MSSSDQHDGRPREPRDERSRGLGDTIARVAKRLGIRHCEACEERRRRLNRIVPYEREIDRTTRKP